MSAKKPPVDVPSDYLSAFDDEMSQGPDPDPSTQAPVPDSYNQFTQMLGALTHAMQGIALSPAALKDILASQAEVTGELARKARWPESPTHPGISAYSYPE